MTTLAAPSAAYDMTAIDDHSLGRLQDTLEDIFLTSAAPQWVLDAHAAIVAEWDRREAVMDALNTPPQFATEAEYDEFFGPFIDETEHPYEDD